MLIQVKYSCMSNCGNDSNPNLPVVTLSAKAAVAVFKHPHSGHLLFKSQAGQLRVGIAPDRWGSFLQASARIPAQHKPVSAVIAL
jgi:hypothetical protein